MKPPFTAPRVYRHLLIIAVLYGGIASSIAIPAIMLGIHFEGRQLLGLLVAIVVATVCILISDVLMLKRHYRPVGIALTRLDNATHTPTILQDGLQRALELPQLTLWRIMLVHTPVGGFTATTTLILSRQVLDTGLQPWQMLLPNALAWTVGISHAILEYFAVQQAIPPLVGYLRNHLTLAESNTVSQRVRRYGIRQRLLYILLAVSFLPLLTLGVTVIAQTHAVLQDLNVERPLPALEPVIGWIFWLVLISLISMSAIALLTTRQFHEQVRLLVAAMQGVSQGQLDQSLSITTTDEFADLYMGFNSMTRGLQERERLHDAFGRYVSPELANQIQSEGVTIGGQALQASVLFCDIRGYTALTEHMEPVRVVEWLNAYFATVEPCIKAEDGWINKFLGDGFMAVFGAPLPRTDHAIRAVRAARAILEATRHFNAEHRAYPPIAIGLGIECGLMVAGSIGSPDRLEYTVIGDAVNVASRIEALNKTFGTTLIVSATVYQAADLDGAWRELPETTVRGKSAAIRLYSLREDDRVG